MQCYFSGKMTDVTQTEWTPLWLMGLSAASGVRCDGSGFAVSSLFFNKNLNADVNIG